MQKSSITAYICFYRWFIRMESEYKPRVFKFFTAASSIVVVIVNVIVAVNVFFDINQFNINNSFINAIIVIAITAISIIVFILFYFVVTTVSPKETASTTPSRFTHNHVQDRHDTANRAPTYLPLASTTHCLLLLLLRFHFLLFFPL